MNKLREWANLVAGEVLTEAQDYESMFIPLINLLKTNPSFDESTFRTTLKQDYISWAKTHLKKADRITLFLKYVRLMYANMLLAAATEDTLPKFMALRDKYVTELTDHKNIGYKDSLESFYKNKLADMQETLLHYLSTPYPPIQNYVFKNTIGQVIEDLDALERKYKEMKQQVIDHDDNDKPVIKFNDGWAWVLLDRKYCSIEGDAMGHCGNTGSPKNGDRILSLRKKIIEDGVLKWRPSLTFILNKDGYLGEMKGRNNNKPDEKYHPYILKLLESDMVKGIVGGGYKPEANFAVSDLTEEQQEELYEKKPILAPISWQYKKNGITEDLIKSAQNYMASNGYDDLVFDMGKKFVKIEEFDNWQSFVGDYGNKEFKWYAEHMEDGDAFDSYSDNGAEKSSKVDILDMVNRKQPEVIKRLRAYIANEYPDAVEFWEEQNEDEWANASTDDMVDILNEEGDQIDNELDSAVSSGESGGAEKECLESMESALEGAIADIQEIPSMSIMLLWDNGENEFRYDTKVWMGFSLTEFFDNIDDIEEAIRDGYSSNVFKPEEVKLDVPHYGYSGYDDDWAVESFLGNNSIPEPSAAEKEDA